MGLQLCKQHPTSQRDTNAENATRSARDQVRITPICCESRYPLESRSNYCRMAIYRATVRKVWALYKSQRRSSKALLRGYPCAVPYRCVDVTNTFLPQQRSAGVTLLLPSNARLLTLRLVGV
ncbi:unnamed protein product [Pleuronectes platessa]|uniref:Uncharacterized protein n=1 Tax=Pleuronectes platessa TaxID=8262 RepID=A0A9N7YGU6_PLEPL|nr:unnamed protein product [Pleuronectes platessa]